MQRNAQSLEDELLDLAAATRRIAGTIDDTLICSRLLRMADELTELAEQGCRSG